MLTHLYMVENFVRATLLACKTVAIGVFLAFQIPGMNCCITICILKEEKCCRAEVVRLRISLFRRHLLSWEVACKCSLGFM